jgi:hypothetical protein
LSVVNTTVCQSVVKTTDCQFCSVGTFARLTSDTSSEALS